MYLSGIGRFRRPMYIMYLTRHWSASSAVRHTLSLNRLSAPLFDTSSYVKHIEAAYSAMYDRYLSGAEPEHIEIGSL